MELQNDGVCPEGLWNPLLEQMAQDNLYHLNISTATHSMSTFSDVKFVCVGGTASRMLKLAEYFAAELHIGDGTSPTNLTGSTDRYVMYKVGPILTASHGVGVPSMLILLHEVAKLLYHAGAKGVTFFRVGTSGGIGLNAGSVVITTEAVDGELKNSFEQFVLGKRVMRPCGLDQQLVADLLACRKASDNFDVVAGKTMCAHDFYEGQARMDGALCDYTKYEQQAFLARLQAEGVKNIEMECVGFAAFMHRLGLRGAVICVTILNRLEDDQVKADHAFLKEFEMRPARIISRYLATQLTADQC